MSERSAKLFLDKIKNDEDFKKKINAYTTGIDRMAFARREGFHFTEEELIQASGGDLSEEDLELVTC